jgi:hypothetical protein
VPYHPAAELFNNTLMANRKHDPAARQVMSASELTRMGFSAKDWSQRLLLVVWCNDLCNCSRHAAEITVWDQVLQGQLIAGIMHHVSWSPGALVSFVIVFLASCVTRALLSV